MNIYTDFARQFLERYLPDKKKFPSLEIPPELKGKQAGCFVSLHTKDKDELRGCIGTIEPTCKNLGAEILSNAVAATQDPRFSPVQAAELRHLKLQIDVLNQPEAVANSSALDPQKYGIIVKTSDGRTGLLLPALDGVESVSDQISICRQKAGILADEPIELYRFTVSRYKED